MTDRDSFHAGRAVANGLEWFGTFLAILCGPERLRIEGAATAHRIFTACIEDEASPWANQPRRPNLPRGFA